MPTCDHTMGQKVNPLAFRLDVPHRGEDSLRFRQPHAVVNRSGSRDRLGWSVSFSGNRDEWTYGANLGLVQSRVRSVTERRGSYGRVVNRSHVHASVGSVVMDVEWRPLDVEAWRDPGMRLGSVRRGGTRVPRISAQRCEEDLAEALGRIEAMYETAGRSLPAGCPIRTVKIHSHNLRHLVGTGQPSSMGTEATTDDISGPSRDGGRDARRDAFGGTAVNPMAAEWNREYEFIQVKARLKGKDSTQRVKAKTRLAALRLAGRHPVAPRVCRRLAMALEDATTPTKHSDILFDLRHLMNKCAATSEFGLRGHREQGLDEHGRRLPPQVHGGYRGCRVRVKGTLDSSRRTRKHVIQRGVVPLSTRSVPMSSWSTAANTKTGSRGVQVIYSY